MKVKQLFTDESRWCQGRFAQTSQGVDVFASSVIACRWCLSGAIYKCYPSSWEDIQDRVKLATGKGIAHWNDTHTFEDVKHLVECLDI